RPQHLDVEIDALGLDAPVHQRAAAVVVPAGEREPQLRHPSMIPKKLAPDSIRGGHRSLERIMLEKTLTPPPSAAPAPRGSSVCAPAPRRASPFPLRPPLPARARRNLRCRAWRRRA